MHWRKECISARNLTRISWQCVAMAFVIRVVKLFLRNVYKLLGPRCSLENSVNIPADARRDLLWCEKCIRDRNHHPVVVRRVQATPTTDVIHLVRGWRTWMCQASGTSVIVSQVLKLQGTQGNSLRNQCLLTTCQREISLDSNKMSPLMYIANQGGPSRELTRTAQAILAVVLENSIYI